MSRWPAWLEWVRRFGGPRPAPVDPAADFIGAATLPHDAVIIDQHGKPVSEACVAMVAKWEGFKPEAYLCPADVWTIGFGTTRWPDGRRVKAGETVSRNLAETLLRGQLADFARDVDRAVRVSLATHERDALVSFAYNIGAAGFASSTLVKLLNAGDRAGAAAQFHRWTKAGGRELQGLVNRRSEESSMFLGMR